MAPGIMSAFSVATPSRADGPSGGGSGGGGPPGTAGGAPGAGSEGEPWQSALRSLQRFVSNPGGPPRDPDSLATPLASDLEIGQDEPQWASWARSAVGRVREQAGQAAEHAQQSFQQATERAQTMDWNEQVQGMRGSVSRGLENLASTTSSATTSLQERVTQGVDRAKSVDWQEHAKGFQRGVTQSFETVSTSVSTTASSATASLQENASAVAGASRRALSVANDRVSGAAALAMDPAKLARFAGVFLLGVFFIMISLNFLPALLLKPGNFAMFFTLGSVTMLSSFVVLNGPQAFMAQLMQRSKLPFSGAYLVGLIGTLVATLFLRSYLFTAIFAITQALALLYLVASYLPGGTSFLNFLGRAGGRSVRSVALG